MKRLLLMASLCIGMIFVSTTTAQITWNKLGSGGGYRMAYGANKYVTMRTGTYSSTDLITWTTRLASIYPRFLYGVTYNSGFVVVGDTGTIYSSPDGITWTKRTSGTLYTLNCVGHSSNLFVAVGDSGTILTSPDGVTWTKRTSGTKMNLEGITYGKGQFVIGGGGA